jgi:8-oxo-dGTP pyrophosphatase MutT (NUDIX family)
MSEGGEGAGRGNAVPGAGEEYNPGPATRPRQAATVIVLRGGSETLEVLLVRRTPEARFMGGVWVFPGGAVDEADIPGGSRGSAAPDDETLASALRTAAARELREEAGMSLADTGDLVEFSRWITPAQVSTRFDTHFFLVAQPEGQQPRVDGEEIVDHGWYTPQAALDAHGAKQIVLVFPTIKHLEQLGRFASVKDLLTHARGRDVQPVEPKVVLEGEVARVLLPGDPGY